MGHVLADTTCSCGTICFKYHGICESLFLTGAFYFKQEVCICEKQIVDEETKSFFFSSPEPKAHLVSLSDR